jgi:hypothetical protein
MKPAMACPDRDARGHAGFSMVAFAAVIVQRRPQ